LSGGGGDGGGGGGGGGGGRQGELDCLSVAAVVHGLNEIIGGRALENILTLINMLK
jgi:hypothetical protein